MPIKRAPELQPISREHHRALLVAHRIVHVLEGRAFAGPAVGFPELLDEMSEFHESHFLPHAREEETRLGPGLNALGPDGAAEFDRLRSEHASLERLMDGACDQDRPDDERRNALRTYGQLLETHVRYEERELFQMIEERFAPELLADIGAALAEYEAGRDPSCRMA